MEKRTVKIGVGKLEKPMTAKQAKRYGDKHMPADLKKAGFQTVVFASDADIHTDVFFRINYGYF